MINARLANHFRRLTAASIQSPHSSPQSGRFQLCSFSARPQEIDPQNFVLQARKRYTDSQKREWAALAKLFKWGFIGIGGFITYRLVLQNSDRPIYVFLTETMNDMGVNPEFAHTCVMALAKARLLPVDMNTNRVPTTAMGLKFQSPIGLAAGFDKDAEAPMQFVKMGFGFVEVGSVVPLPQPGNERPRVFKLVNDKAIINRFGCNSKGVEKAAKRLEASVAYRDRDDLSINGILGVNIGKNKATQDPVADFVTVARKLGSYADYLVINVSSPNTPGLRDLAEKEVLEKIVKGVQFAAEEACVNEKPKEGKMKRKRPPIVVKISPDMTDEQKRGVVEVVLNNKVEGIVVANTTVQRPDSLKTKKFVEEKGGLSGEPLKERTMNLIAEMYKLTEGKVTIIASGGISSGKDALRAIESGASLVQVYSAFIYYGPGIARKIENELSALLGSRGYKTVGEAVGSRVIPKKGN
eukprot:GHVN01047684.1.p1 GENE.GHVN01047684.1~~GHVN01047684.1.p1  ORF type:complete len:482 (-),score=99.13 GHVN01047684.1:131-1534(-)